MKHKKHTKHTGRIRHADMTSLLDGHGSKDKFAHSSHHAMNSEHGTLHGCGPHGDYDDGGEGHTEGLHGDNQEFETGDY